MYKCIDCGMEYEQAVEYCECGNNTFEVVDELPSIKKSFQMSFAVGEIVSYLIFVSCLVLSFLIVFCIGNPEIKPKSDQNVQAVNKKVLQKDSNIPSIDKLWDSTAPVAKTQSAKTEPEMTQQPKPKTTFVQNILKPQKSKNEKVKSSSNTVSKPQINNGTRVQKNNDKQAEQKTNVQPLKNDIQKLTQKFNTEPVVLEPQITDANNPTFINYKKALLEKLFSRFVVSAVQGDGVCVVSFKIDKTGKLTERNFVKQSDNKTLNDTVYYMFMSVPKFNPPPSVYKGDELKIQVKFINGNYEFSYL